MTWITPPEQIGQWHDISRRYDHDHGYWEDTPIWAWLGQVASNVFPFGLDDYDHPYGGGTGSFEGSTGFDLSGPSCGWAGLINLHGSPAIPIGVSLRQQAPVTQGSGTILDATFSSPVLTGNLVVVVFYDVSGSATVDTVTEGFNSFSYAASGYWGVAYGTAYGPGDTLVRLNAGVSRSHLAMTAYEFNLTTDYANISVHINGAGGTLSPPVTDTISSNGAAVDVWAIKGNTTAPTSFNNVEPAATWEFTSPGIDSVGAIQFGAACLTNHPTGTVGIAPTDPTSGVTDSATWQLVLEPRNYLLDGTIGWQNGNIYSIFADLDSYIPVSYPDFKPVLDINQEVIYDTAPAYLTGWRVSVTRQPTPSDISLIEGPIKGAFQYASANDQVHFPTWIDGDAGLTINTHVVTTYSSSADAIAYIDSAKSDFTSLSAQMLVVGSGSSGLMFRMAADFGSFFKWISGGLFYVNGSSVSSVTGANLSLVSFSDNDVLEVVAQDDLLTFTQNGISRGYIHRSENLHETRHGLIGNSITDSTARFQFRGLKYEDDINRPHIVVYQDPFDIYEQRCDTPDPDVDGVQHALEVKVYNLPDDIGVQTLVDTTNTSTRVSGASSLVTARYGTIWGFTDKTVYYDTLTSVCAARTPIITFPAAPVDPTTYTVDIADPSPGLYGRKHLRLAIAVNTALDYLEGAGIPFVSSSYLLLLDETPEVIHRDAMSIPSPIVKVAPIYQPRKYQVVPVTANITGGGTSKNKFWRQRSAG